MSHLEARVSPGLFLEHIHLIDPRRGGPDTTEVDYALNRIGLSLQSHLQGAVITVPRPPRDTFPEGRLPQGVPEEHTLNPAPDDGTAADHGVAPK
jgi:hypothetical protein